MMMMMMTTMTVVVVVVAADLKLFMPSNVCAFVFYRCVQSVSI